MTPKRRISIGLAVGAVVLCYGGVIARLIQTWMTNPVYSFGLVLPLISAYMLSTRWSQLRLLEAEPDYVFGIPVTFVGVAMLMLGRVIALVSIQEVSLIVTIAGLVLLLSGRRALGQTWFPLTYLMLGMPIWSPAIGALQPPSQLLSTRMATTLLHAVGIPAFREGTQILLPAVRLDVLRECSGVNQLLAIVSMALPAAYLFLDGSIRRAVFVGFAACLAYFSNASRIAMVGFLAYRGVGTGDLQRVHLYEGLAVSVLGYLVLFGCLPLFSIGKTRDDSSEDVEPVSAPTSSSDRRRAWLELGTLTAVLVGGILPLLFKPSDVRLNNDLGAFPTSIGEWTVDTSAEAKTGRFPAIEDEFVHAYPTPAGERRFTSIDDELVRAYRNKAGARVRLYIGYLRSQREGKELAGEASSALQAVASPVRVALGSRTIDLNQVVQRQSRNQRGLFYWYDFNGRVADNMYRGKAYMAWDALTRRRTNGAVVMIAWEQGAGPQPEIAPAEALFFTQEVMALLPGYLPS